MAKTADAGEKQSLQTQKRVADGLLKLMEEHSFQEITVTQICQEAEIARVTFYRLFETKEDVIRFYLHGLLSDFSEEFGPESDSVKALRILFDSFPIPVSVLKMLMQQGLYTVLYSEFQSVIGHFFRVNGIKEMTDQMKRMNSYRINFIASTLLNIFMTWVDNGCRESKEELIEIASRQLRISDADRQG